MVSLADTWRTIDRSLFLALNGDMGPFADSFFWTVSYVPTWIPLYLFLGWVLYRTLGWRKMLLAIALLSLGVIIADQIANIFKYGVQKLRPTHNPLFDGIVHIVKGYRGGLYGTVSAHAATTMAISAFVSLIYRRWWVTTAMFLWAAVVCYSRIYLGVHYPADIFFGTINGLFWGWLAYRVFVKASKKPKFCKPV